ncbi:hypothetical protein SCP_1600430 [Sparassis crispa]|uniref:Uncharacterized protein n=1 Tax=Sparassis crispa TaxID=139825 RepID=A0A401H4P2_9APHY|nr:hypothetical protein SCP_1600430 [Sparassis crispa]GBE89382.1 hypothetical protein SCP_1600430 [Sparassis crispa]
MSRTPTLWPSIHTVHRITLDTSQSSSKSIQERFAHAVRALQCVLLVVLSLKVCRPAAFFWAPVVALLPQRRYLDEVPETVRIRDAGPADIN